MGYILLLSYPFIFGSEQKNKIKNIFILYIKIQIRRATPAQRARKSPTSISIFGWNLYVNPSIENKKLRLNPNYG
jgi:hypothetical protein